MGSLEDTATNYGSDDDYEGASLYRLPSYRSRSTRSSRPPQQNARPPSYITDFDAQSVRSAAVSVESSANDSNVPFAPRRPRPPTYQTDIASVHQLDVVSEGAQDSSSVQESVPTGGVDRLNERVNGIRIEDPQPTISQTSSEHSSPVFERLEPLRANASPQLSTPTSEQGSPNTTRSESGPTNFIARGLQRARTARNTQTPSSTVLARSSTLPANVPNPARQPPPVPSFPSVYIIKHTIVEPLVTTSLLRAHLSLLCVFWMMRKSVEEMENPRNPPVEPWPRDKEGRWAWFVGFAVERFTAWSEALKKEDKTRTLEELVPPADVVMVWHTYLLNPGWYAEDCLRIPTLKILCRIGQLVFAPHLLHALATILCETTTHLRRQNWELKTQGRPFDILEDARQNKLKLIWCPDCQEPVLHPYMNPQGTGYLQQNFKAKCSNNPCYFNTYDITKMTLGARKLAEDLVRPEDDTSRSHIAGTFWSAGGVDDGTRARKLKDKILKFEDFRCPRGLADEQMLPMLLKRHRNDPLRQNRLTGRDDMVNEGWVLSILYRHQFSPYQIIDGIAVLLKAAGSDPEAITRRIFSAYTDGNLFSADLRGSTMRQSAFVEQMHKIGWLEADFLQNMANEPLFQYALVRYHGFLDLLSANATSLCVPTLDTDLAWHTHQLGGPRYHTSCMTCLGRLIDHNDKVEENRLSDAFEDTCKAWRARFDVSYISCGCPAGKGVDEYVNGYLGLSGFRTESSAFYEGNLQLPAFKKLSITPSTHPSDHDAVYNNRQPGKSDKLRAVRLEKRERKLKTDGKLLKSLALTLRKDKRPEEASENPHEPPFMHLLPAWYPHSDLITCPGHAAHMVDNQPLGEIGNVPPEMKKYSDCSCVALHTLK